MSDASPSISSIRINTKVEDRPAWLAGSGYLAIAIALVFVACAGLLAWSAISQPSAQDVPHPVLTVLCILGCLAICQREYLKCPRSWFTVCLGDQLRINQICLRCVIMKLRPRRDILLGTSGCHNLVLA